MALNRTMFLGWGLGSFTTSVLINFSGVFYLRFMTDSLGIGAALAGGMLALSKFYDAATDPVMGMISDRTRSRWGRHRPYLLFGAILSALSMVMMFNAPDAAGGWLAAYEAGVLVLFSTAYTMFRVPYLAMGAEIARGFHARSILMTFSVYGSSIGSLFATSAAPLLLARLGGGRTGHSIVASILAALILAGGLACFWTTSGAVEASPALSPARIGLRDRLSALRDNRPFLALIAFKMIMFTGMALHNTAIAFYTRHVLKVSDTSLGAIYLVQTMAMMGSQPLWVRLSRRYGRRGALTGAALLEILVMTSWTLVPVAQPMPWVLILGICQGLCSGGLFFGLYTILPDTMDYDRKRSGIEREGIFAGIFVMVEKVTAAVATGIFGGILGASGYIAAKDAGSVTQPASAIEAIMVALAIIPAVAAVLACLALRYYDLDASRAPGAAAPASPVIAPATTMKTLLALGLLLLWTVSACAQNLASVAPSAGATVPSSVKVKRLYAGPDGESHLDEIELPRAGGVEGRSINTRLYTTDAELGYSAPGTFIDWHGVTTPRFMIILSGNMDIGLGDGSKHLLKAGDIVLAMDMTGHGHTSRVLGDTPSLVMTVRLPKDDPLKLKSNPCPDNLPAANCVTSNAVVTGPPK